MRLNLILAIVAAVLAWPCILTRNAELKEEFVDEAATPLMFPGFDPDQVQVISVAKRRPEQEILEKKLPPEEQYDEIVFIRQEGHWVLRSADRNKNGLPLDEDKVQRYILDHVAELRVDKETQVPEDQITKEFREEQQITPETGTLIRCLRGPQGPVIVDLILGKSTSQGKVEKGAVDAYYVTRRDRSKEVVLYEPAEAIYLPLRDSEWTDKKIHRFDLNLVDTFYFKNQLGSAAFKKKRGSEATWEAIADKCPKDVGAPRQGEIAILISNFNTVSAERFLRKKIEGDKGGAEVEVRATMIDGTEYAMWVGPVGQPNAKAVASNHENQFEIAEFHVQNLRRQDPLDLFDPK